MSRTVAPWERKREVFVKAEDETNPQFGCSPEKKPAEALLKCGVINLDKPAGPSSHEVAAWTKRLMCVDSVGHGGTLEA
jgi:H/ACA ribonucleoprotein complex subunit 4